MDSLQFENIDFKGDVTIVSINTKDDPPDQSTTSNPSQTQQETHFKVSSNLLMESSGYFKARLGPNWPEGQELAQKGSVEIEIDGFDPEAVSIVLNILHLRHDQVPLQANLELMTRVALVTDYFQCNRALSFIGKTWFSRHYSYYQDTQHSPEYVFVCHVFGIKNHLDGVISRQWKGAKCPFDPGNLPIPTSITDQINGKLQSFHDDLVTKIGKQVIQNLRDLPMEGYTCDSLRLGFWAKGKRSSISSKSNVSKCTPRSISNVIHELCQNARHTCTKGVWGRWGECPNFQKLLGEELLTQLNDAKS